MVFKKNTKNLIIGIVLFLLLLSAVFRYCSSKIRQSEIETLLLKQDEDKVAYNDTINFLRGQLDLQQEKSTAQTEVVVALERQLDSLAAKHEATKKKVKPVLERFNNDTGYVLAPNEYINECEQCFTLSNKYKAENTQLRFERDAYDGLMRSQSQIDSNRIAELEWQAIKANVRLGQLQKNIPTCDTTRKLKFSVMGMANSLFLPKAGGVGLVYEDKKFNEYGAHVLFSAAGNIYLFNIAKTISLRKKNKTK